jgi:virginiamycin B lyase
MLALPLRPAAALAFGAIAIAVSLLTMQPVSAVETENEIEIHEWKVPDAGRPRDPFAAGPDQVWFVDQVNGYLGRLTPSTGDVFKRDLGQGAGPHNLIVDTSGIVWFSGNRNAYIGRYDPKTDTIERIAMPDPAAADPHTLVFDADQSHIWFTVQGGNFIGRLNLADKSVALAPVPTQDARPYGIKIAPDGTPWIALLGTNKLASIDPETLVITEYAIPEKNARPRRLEITSDGRVWYSDYARGKLGRYDPKAKSFAEWTLPSGNASAPYGTALDGNGRIWVVETGVQPNLFVGFDPQKEKIISITPVPSGGGTIRHMMYDPETGFIWFGADTGTIGRADVSQVGK